MKKLQKSLKNDLKKVLIGAILSNRQSLRMRRAAKLIGLEKSLKKYKTRLEKLKKL